MNIQTFENLDKEEYKNLSFLFKEQYISSNLNKTFFTVDNFEAIRLHYITGAKIITPNQIIENIQVPSILQYSLYSNFQSDKKIILLDDNITPMCSVGWHFKMALEKICTRFFYQHQKDLVNIEDADLIITVRYNPRPKNFKGIYVIYDTEALHRSTKQLIEISQVYDYVFLTTLQDVEILNFLGFKNIFWLPPASSLDYHKPKKEYQNYKYHATMIGNYNPQLKRDIYNRFTFFEKVANRCSIFFGRAGVGDAYIKKLWEAPIALDRSTGYNIGTRIFEALACGRFVLTNHLIEKNKNTGLNLLLNPGLHFGYYLDNPENCYKELMYWINRGDRDELALEASNFVRKYHSWQNRLSTLLEFVL